ncbi:unnamed protein product [Mytilus edulis]|uniref:Uncharacterized protein n=1 Tax=Mytilus edulis TaxID=6550 RepID=A0A8S3S910_MYTED|nr:unnamed protein product [Mytilus edulis]
MGNVVSKASQRFSRENGVEKLQKSDWNCGYMEKTRICSVGTLADEELGWNRYAIHSKDVEFRNGSNSINLNRVCLLNDIQSYPGYRDEHIQELFPQNYQAADDSKKNLHTTLQLGNAHDDKEILYRVQKGKTRKIPDLENNMVNPMKTSFNTERYVRGSSGTPNNNETEGDIKMSCAMAFKKKF